jgi:hypothetical protein
LQYPFQERNIKRLFSCAQVSIFTVKLEGKKKVTVNQQLLSIKHFLT